MIVLTKHTGSCDMPAAAVTKPAESQALLLPSEFVPMIDEVLRDDVNEWISC